MQLQSAGTQAQTHAATYAEQVTALSAGTKAAEEMVAGAVQRLTEQLATSIAQARQQQRRLGMPMPD